MAKYALNVLDPHVKEFLVKEGVSKDELIVK